MASPPRLGRGDLLLALQRNPKEASAATDVVVSALQTMRTSAMFWQYAIRRLRTACVVIQRFVRRFVIASRLVITRTTDRWVTTDKALLGRLEGAATADGFSANSPFLFFDDDTRFAVVTQMFRDQRSAHRRRYRLYLHEQRNMALSLRMLQDDLASYKRRLTSVPTRSLSLSGRDSTPTSSPLRARSLAIFSDNESLTQHRRSLFAGSLSMGPNAGRILEQTPLPFGQFAAGGFSTSRSNSLAGGRISPADSGFTSSSAQPSNGNSPRNFSLAGVQTSAVGRKAEARKRRAREKAVAVVRHMQQKISDAYGAIQRHRLHTPKFEFVADMKELRAAAMAIYSDEAAARVQRTVTALGVGSPDPEAIALSKRVALDHVMLSAKARHTAEDGLNAVSGRRAHVALPAVEGEAAAPARPLDEERQHTCVPPTIGYDSVREDATYYFGGEGERTRRGEDIRPAPPLLAGVRVGALVRGETTSPRTTPRRGAHPSVAAFNHASAALQSILSRQAGVGGGRLRPSTPQGESGLNQPRRPVGCGVCSSEDGVMGPSVSSFTPTPPQAPRPLADTPTRGGEAGATFITETQHIETAHSSRACMPQSEPSVAVDASVDDLTVEDFETELAAFRQRRGQGGALPSFQWSARARGFAGSSLRPVSRLPLHAQHSFNASRREVPTRAVSVEAFEGHRGRVAAPHPASSLLGEGAVMGGQRGSSSHGSLARAPQVVGTRASTAREVSAKQRMAAEEERCVRDSSLTRAAVGSPRRAAEGLDELNGAYPYHRFCEVYHPTMADRLGAGAISKSVVSALFSGASAERQGSDGTYTAPLPLDRPRVVTIDPITGLVRIERHLLRHLYPTAAPPRAPPASTHDSRQPLTTMDFVPHSSGRISRRMRGNSSYTGGAQQQQQQQQQLSAGLMERLMDEYAFTEATRIAVRGVVAGWRGERGVASRDRSGGDGHPFEGDPFASAGSSAPIAPFRRAPSSKDLKRPLAALVSVRNHNSGITAVTVINSIADASDGGKCAEGAGRTARVPAPPRGPSFIGLSEGCGPQPPSAGGATNPQSAPRTHGSRHLVATGALDGLLRISSFPDMTEVCNVQSRSGAMITHLQASRDGAGLCVVSDDGLLRFFRRRSAQQWASPWDCVSTVSIDKQSGSHALSVALYGDGYLAVGCYAGRLYVLPMASLLAERPSTSAAPIPSPIAKAAILSLETNVSGVAKVLSYNPQMLITGGLDGQCNVVRLAYGEAAVREMRARQQESEAALSRAIARTLGVSDPAETVKGAEAFGGAGAIVDALLPASHASPTAAVSAATGRFAVQRGAVSQRRGGGSGSGGTTQAPSSSPRGGGGGGGGGLPPFAVETARPFTCHTAAVVDLAYVGPSGDLVCSAGLDRRVCVWDALSFDLRYTFNLASVLRSSLLVVPSPPISTPGGEGRQRGASLLVCPLDNASIVTLSAESGEIVSETSQEALKDPCVAGCVLPQRGAAHGAAASLVALGTYGGRVLVLDAARGEFVASSVTHDGAILCMASCQGPPSAAVAAEEQFLVTCSDDRVTAFSSLRL